MSDALTSAVLNPPDALTSAILNPPDALTSAILNPPSPSALSVARVACPRCEAAYPLGAFAPNGGLRIDCPSCRFTFAVLPDERPGTRATSLALSNLWTDMDFDDAGESWEIETERGLRYSFDDAYTLLRYLAAGRVTVQDNFRVDRSEWKPVMQLPELADCPVAPQDTPDRLVFVMDRGQPSVEDPLESGLWEVFEIDPPSEVEQDRRARRLAALLAMTAVGLLLTALAIRPPAAQQGEVAAAAAPVLIDDGDAVVSLAVSEVAEPAPAPAVEDTPALAPPVLRTVMVTEPAVEPEPEPEPEPAQLPKALTVVPDSLIPDGSRPLTATALPFAPARPAAPPVEELQPEETQAARAARTWYDASQVAREQGRLGTAREMLVRSVIRAPEAAEYWAELASVQSELGETGDAAFSASVAAELLANR